MLFKSLATTLAAAATLATISNAYPTAPPPPRGGVDGNSSAPPPSYTVMTDYDFQSLNLALNQEWIELDLFHYALARFSPEEFEAAGINAEQQSLIEYMGNQEVGHSTLVQNILQGRGAKQCKYAYNFQTVQEWVQFSATLTRWGESGVWGFLSHLDSRPAATLLVQAESVEARQQMIFRQFAGAFPMPFWFVPGISQAMHWTLLSPYLVECPAENPRIEWPIFPTLNIQNNPNLTAEGYQSAASTNRTAFITPNMTELYFAYDAPGQNVSYNNSYQTVFGRNVTSPIPTHCVFISQLNATNVPFNSTGNNTGSCLVPGGVVFSDDGVVNGTNFVALISEDVYVTPYNLSLLNDVIVAGPAVFISG